MVPFPRPSFIIATADVPEELGQYPNHDEPLAFGRPIGKVGGLQKIGLHIERSKTENRIFYPLHPHRRQEVGEAGWWTNVPLQPQGVHDGRPTAPKSSSA